MPPIRQSMSESSPLQLWTCFFSVWPFHPSGCDVTWKPSCNYCQALFNLFLFTTQVLNVRPRRYNISCRKPFQRSGKLAPWVLKLLRISWSSISDSVSVPWNNTRLAVTESCLLLCQYRLQVSIHLPALINYTSQWQITPHSFVCSHMHGNKRIRYQGKLIYSDEDGVPTALSEMNACTQRHRPAWQLSRRGILSMTLLYVCLLVAAHILPCGSHPDVIYHQVLIINPT